MNVLAHHAYSTLVRSPTSLGYRFRASCRCGWKGPLRQTDRAAWGDADEHEAAHPLRAHIGPAREEGS